MHQFTDFTRSGNLERNKRDVEIRTENSSFDPLEANFTLQVITTACRAWNRESNTWDSENCKVSCSS